MVTGDATVLAIRKALILRKSVNNIVDVVDVCLTDIVCGRNGGDRVSMDDEYKGPEKYRELCSWRA